MFLVGLLGHRTLVGPQKYSVGKCKHPRFKFYLCWHLTMVLCNARSVVIETWTWLKTFFVLFVGWLVGWFVFVCLFVWLFFFFFFTNFPSTNKKAFVQFFFLGNFSNIENVVWLGFPGIDWNPRKFYLLSLGVILSLPFLFSLCLRRLDKEEDEEEDLDIAVEYGTCLPVSSSLSSSSSSYSWKKVSMGISGAHRVHVQIHYSLVI